MTFNVVCETDASAGRAMATRRGVGRVRHLDARLWLQQLCAESVFQVRARPGEHNEADLETKICRFQMIDLAFERKNPFDRQWVGAHGWWRRLSQRLPCTCQEREEHVRDKRAGSGSVGMVIVILMVLSDGPLANPNGEMTVVGRRRPTRMLRNYNKWKISSIFMRRCSNPDSSWNPTANNAEMWI